MTIATAALLLTFTLEHSLREEFTRRLAAAPAPAAPPGKQPTELSTPAEGCTNAGADLKCAPPSTHWQQSIA